MEKKEKKEFFASIAKLPLQEKVTEVRKKFPDEEEAFGILLPLVSRDKSLTMDEKIEFVELEFPQRKEQFVEMIEKKQNSKPRNLSNRVHLVDVLKKETQGFEDCSRQPLGTVDIDQRKELQRILYRKNQKVLNTINAFLVQKRELDEYVEKMDCERIEKLLIPELYIRFRDQYNSLIINCFRFRKQLIKKKASNFVKKILNMGYFDTVLLLELVRGGYVSTETMSILQEFHDKIIQNPVLLKEIKSELRSLQEIPKTGDERKLLESIIKLYNA